jgi:two-component system chemotaxis response regulator CheY
MARVLVVDDSAFMRNVVGSVLRSGGHEVIGEASDGHEAARQYARLTPELTTLDITMPNRDGLSALRDILSHDPSAKVLVCSAMGQGHKIAEALDSGAKGFVVKPFDPDGLLDAVARAVVSE